MASLADQFLLDAKAGGAAIPAPDDELRPYTPEEAAQHANDLRVSISGTAAPASLADQFLKDAQAGASTAAPAPSATAAPSNDRSMLGNMLLGATKGAADLVQGPAQLILNGAAKLSGDGPASQYVKDKAAQFNDYLKNQEDWYQSETPGSLSAGAGRVGSGALPFILSGGSSAAPTLAGTLANGAAFGAISPVNSGNDGNFWKDKAIQSGIGAATAGIGAKLGNALAGIVKPNISADAGTMIDNGVTPTIGQLLGGAWGKTEDKLTSVPILGDMIKNAQRRGIDQFNTAAYNRALGPLGQEAQTGIVGREGVQAVKTALGNAYDNLLPKLQFKADQQFGSEMSNLTSMVSNGNVKPEFAKQFDSIVKNEVFSRMTKQGAMDGQSFKDMESSLGQKIKAFSGSQDPDQRALGDALQEVLSSARGVLTRANPQYADELSKINQGYANYATIRRAASGIGAESGVFTPAQLQSAVKAGDKSAGKGNFATGNALMQDLSESGKNVLSQKYPDSGTVGRALLMGSPAAAGAAYASPLAAGVVGGLGGIAMLPYTQTGQKLAAALLTKRPVIAAPLADAIRASSPALSTAISPSAAQFLHQYLK